MINTDEHKKVLNSRAISKNEKLDFRKSKCSRNRNKNHQKMTRGINKELFQKDHFNRVIEIIEKIFKATENEKMSTLEIVRQIQKKDDTESINYVLVARALRKSKKFQRCQIEKEANKNHWKNNVLWEKRSFSTLNGFQCLVKIKTLTIA